MRCDVAELRQRFKGTRCDTDARGNVRWYVIDPDGKKIRLRAEAGSDAWIAQYKAALRGDHIAGRALLPGTLAHMIKAWQASPEWAATSPVTQSTRKRMLNAIIRSSGHRRVSEIGGADIRAGRDARKATPSEANNTIKLLSALFAWGMEHDLAETNPAKGIKRLPTRKGGFHTWTVAECLQYEARHPVGTTARTVYALALYLSARRQDLPKLGPQHRTGDGYMRLMRHKVRGRDAAPQEVWIVAPLAEALDAMPSGSMTYVATAYGGSFSIAGLGGKFRQWCDQAGLPQCSLHGLRKACVARMAEAGCSSKDMQSVSDHESLAELEVYARESAKKLASRRALEQTFGDQTAFSATIKTRPAGKSRIKNNKAEPARKVR